MKYYSTLELRPQRRTGEKFTDGAWKTERNFIDFVVDDHSLYETLVLAKGFDLISALWLDRLVLEFSMKAASRLLLLEPSDFPNDRRSLFICPECGDLGCGAISHLVQRGSDSVTWRDFGHENNYENLVSTEHFSDVGPFVFRDKEYESVLQGALRTLQRS